MAGQFTGQNEWWRIVSVLIWIEKYILKLKAAHQLYTKNWYLFSLDSYSTEDVQLKCLDNSPEEMNDDELSLPQFELNKIF